MFSVTTAKANQTYFLHIKPRNLPSGKTTYLFYFSKSPEGAEVKIPDGFHVVENERTGLPFLKKNA